MGLKSPVPCTFPFLAQSIKSYRPVALTSRTNLSGTRRIVVEGDTPSRVRVLPGIQRDQIYSVKVPRSGAEI